MSSESDGVIIDLAKRVADLEKENERLLDDLDEEARLSGMGGSREFNLKTEIVYLKRRIAELEDPHYLKSLQNEINRLEGALHKIEDGRGDPKEIATAALRYHVEKS